MLWVVVVVILILLTIAYFATKKKEEQPKSAVPEPSNQSAPSSNPAVPEPPKQTIVPAPTSNTVGGLFEITLKGDTGAEKIVVTIDGIRYDAFNLTKDIQKIRIETPSKVNLANVTLKDISPTRDTSGTDTNIRIASIYVNGSNENMRSRLYQGGDKQTYISNGLWFWGGELTFQMEPTGLDPSTQANSTLPSIPGTIEIDAKGDVGNEQLRVLVDGFIYPAPGGTLNEDGTFAPGVYVIPVEGTKILVKTPRLVDLTKVTIQFVNDGADPVTQKDRNVRVSSIIINGDGQDVRPRLFRSGLDETRLTNLRNGGFFWSGDYTFV